MLSVCLYIALNVVCLFVCCPQCVVVSSNVVCFVRFLSVCMQPYLPVYVFQLIPRSLVLVYCLFVCLEMHTFAC